MQRLTAICVRHPWLAVAVTLALTGLAGWSALRTGIAVGTDANLGADHPAVRQFDEFLERFGGGYPIVVAFQCAEPGVCDDVFDPAALEMASSVSHDLEQSSFVSRVSSPATARLLVPSGDLGLEARQLVVDGKAVEDPELRRQALADPLWSRTLVCALSLGFLSMIASPMASIASLGPVSAIAIVGATLADLLVLPALIALVATSRRLGPTLGAASIPPGGSPPPSL